VTKPEKYGEKGDKASVFMGTAEKRLAVQVKLGEVCFKKFVPDQERKKKPKSSDRRRERSG